MNVFINSLYFSCANELRSAFEIVFVEHITVASYIKTIVIKKAGYSIIF